MRPRSSLVGPLLLILIGALFLMRAVVPDFRIGEVFRLYWPYLLIGWGALSLIEIAIRFATGSAIPMNGISGGSWAVVILIAIAGLTSYEVWRPGSWWQNVGFERGFAAFGEGHEYSVTPVQKEMGSATHIVIERFRGDAKITGADGNSVTVSGHKEIRAFDEPEASRTNAQTPVDVLLQGTTLVIRCNQDKADSRTPVTTYLEITVPKGANIEATGTNGDFDISSVNGDIDVSSENAGVRLQDLGGSAKVETRRSDLIRAVNIKGTVDLRGHGEDVELTNITGQVIINGDYTGTVSLRDLAKPVRVEDMHTHLEIQQIMGEVRIDRGSLSLQNVVGPMKLNTHSTDVELDGVSNDVSMDVDKGDIELRPGRLPLGKINIHTRAGNIELALPQSANFALSANTDHGEVDNQFGDQLKEETQGRGARLQGTVGNGPDVTLTSGRGNITVRKSTVESVSATKAA
ncbi:MAG: DUF4097 family beta strand repeat protein [Acidobacteriaceae bacterium]|nr:DUF4097 family beta strand repeat protein [Acidobacteriaceae bacterium]